MNDIKNKKVYCKNCDNEISYILNDNQCKVKVNSNNINLINYIKCPNCNKDIIVNTHNIRKE